MAGRAVQTDGRSAPGQSLRACFPLRLSLGLPVPSPFIARLRGQARAAERWRMWLIGDTNKKALFCGGALLWCGTHRAEGGAI
jgi:hypothetical protein